MPTNPTSTGTAHDELRAAAWLVAVLILVVVATVAVTVTTALGEHTISPRGLLASTAAAVAVTVWANCGGHDQDRTGPRRPDKW